MNIRFSLLVLLILNFTFSACNKATTTPTPNNKPAISSFTASPTNLPTEGGSVTLNWDVNNAETLSIDNGVGAVTGNSQTVSVTSTTTFTLTASNAEGSVEQSTNVTVASDLEQPTVISVDPPNGATGVKSDAIITLSFSTPMDQAATESAYESLDLPASDVSFFWNNEGTVLEIESSNFLEYAKGNLTVAAKQYTFSLSASAQDTSGNSLAPFSSSFSTLRAISNECFGIADLEGQVFANGTVEPNGSVIEVGDYAHNVGVRGLFSFDLSTCLPPDAQPVSEAVFNAYKFSAEGNPDDLGFMTLEHLNYGDSLSADDYTTPALENLGIFDSTSVPDRTWISSVVTPSVQDDIANLATRGNRSQFRLSFASETDNNNDFDIVNFYATDPVMRSDFAPFLQVYYLTP